LVSRDIFNATRISATDFAILSTLVDTGRGKLRQHELAEVLRWDKGRLSHQLTRMEGRDLIVRRPLSGRAVFAEITKSGREILAEAKRAQSNAVRQYFLDQLTERDVVSLIAIHARATRLIDDRSSKVHQ